MTNVTLAVPKELHEEMRRHPEIKWSEVARQAFQREVESIHLFDRLLARSELSETDAVALGRTIRRAAARRHT
ncbi:MAG: hypothetical protein KGI89_14615 [Euryarchaeota archaeon]|nr:hypothetical protein [Euryarchaeota archaeon]